MRPIAERHELTMLQLAAHGTSRTNRGVRGAHADPGAGAGARPIEDKRAELARTAARSRLTPTEVAEMREIGDNTGCMALKGGAPDHEGEAGRIAGRSARSWRRWRRAGASTRARSQRRRHSRRIAPSAHGPELNPKAFRHRRRQ